MKTDTIAAIREAAKRIAPSHDEFASRQAHEILRLLDEAEKDTCRMIEKDPLDGWYLVCDKCGHSECTTGGDYCPGCGRKIEGGTENG